MTMQADPKPTPPPPGSAPGKSPQQGPVPPADAPHAEDLDPEEDIAPNLGGEDQMQDA